MKAAKYYIHSFAFTHLLMFSLALLSVCVVCVSFCNFTACVFVYGYSKQSRCLDTLQQPVSSKVKTNPSTCSLNKIIYYSQPVLCPYVYCKWREVWPHTPGRKLPSTHTQVPSWLIPFPSLPSSPISFTPCFRQVLYLSPGACRPQIPPHPPPPPMFGLGYRHLQSCVPSGPGRKAFFLNLHCSSLCCPPTHPPFFKWVERVDGEKLGGYKGAEMRSYLLLPADPVT